jgi:hypothetical protein
MVVSSSRFLTPSMRKVSCTNFCTSIGRVLIRNVTFTLSTVVKQVINTSILGWSSKKKDHCGCVRISVPDYIMYGPHKMAFCSLYMDFLSPFLFVEQCKVHSRNELFLASSCNAFHLF